MGLARRTLVALLGLCLSAPVFAAHCGQTGIALQVLGSGGPIADDARAASGYLIWQAGRARVLVDAGGGVFTRYGEAGARLEDLDLIALTHLHTDHVTDLAAILKGGYFSSRTAALNISGPGGNTLMPSLPQYLAALFSPEYGAYRYLSGFMTGTDGLFALQAIELDAQTREPVFVHEAAQLTVRAVGVHHGPVPSLGYLIEIAGKRIAISGDQNLADDAFTKLASKVDLLVMPMAIPQDAGELAQNLHATPARIGAAAKRAQPARLIVSHLMQRSLRELDANLAAIREQYRGDVSVAEDLACYEIGLGQVLPPTAGRQ